MMNAVYICNRQLCRAKKWRYEKMKYVKRIEAGGTIEALNLYNMLQDIRSYDNRVRVYVNDCTVIIVGEREFVEELGSFGE